MTFQLAKPASPAALSKESSATPILAPSGSKYLGGLTRPETLETCHLYKEQLSTINGHEVPSILLANKVDLVAERAITDEMLKASCLTTYHPHYLTSAKTGEQVEVAFASLAEQLVPA